MFGSLGVGLFGAADAGEAGLLDIRLDGISLLEMAWRKDKHERPLRQHPFVDSQQHLVLARPGRAAEQDPRVVRNAMRRKPRAQLRLLRRIAVRDVELERACHGDSLRRRSRRDEPRLVEVALRKDLREAGKDVLEEETREPVARRAAVGDARIDEEKRNAALLRLADEVRPDLALRQDDRARTHRLERAFDEVREVERIVDERVVRADLALGHLPPGRARRREAEADGRLDRTPLAHELPRDLHLADGNGVDPDGGRSHGRRIE